MNNIFERKVKYLDEDELCKFVSDRSYCNTLHRANKHLSKVSY